MDDIISLRKNLHKHAELSGFEEKTASIIQDFISETQPHSIITDIAGSGILATWNAQQQGPDILLRADMDGLPIEDAIDTAYVSEKEGTGHKCGHDGHMAILASVAVFLGKNKLQKGSVSLLFQPAEENGAGAEAVLKDQAFPPTTYEHVFALHNLPGFPTASIIVRDSYFASASEGIIFKFKGKSSHAAEPEQGSSPALAVAQLINSISSLPQFHTALHQSAKATIIHARVGNVAFGTSPSDGIVMATLRAYDDAVLRKLQQKAIEIAKGIAQTYNLSITYEISEPFPATVNSEASCSIIRSVAKDMELTIIEPENPFPWSEDFGHFTKKFNGVLFGLGSGENHPSLHNPDYDFPDEIIEVGKDIFVNIISTICGVVL